MKEIASILLFLLVMIGCSSRKAEKKDIEAKVSESKVDNSQALGGTINELIENSKTLTPVQKQQLYHLMDANKLIADKLAQESFKARAVLVEELLTGKATRRKIKILEKAITKIENQKLKNTFDTVEKISAIVSKEADRKAYEKHMLNIIPGPAIR